MVFYYSIRGGPCRNANSHIVLDGEKDIVCYVGRDKHENEFLIKYGWPGDIWFHVDGLSSAHVYFRIKNLHANTRIPIDGIPIDDCKCFVWMRFSSDVWIDTFHFISCVLHSGIRFLYLTFGLKF